MIRGRFKSFEFWDGFVFGVFFISMLACIFLLIFNNIFDIENQVMATFLGVTVAILSIFVSIRRQNNLNQDNLNNELASARVVLPLAISELYRVAQIGIQLAAGLHQNRASEKSEIMEILKISPDSLAALRDCVKFSDEITRDWISVMLARYQVYYSRSESLADSAIEYEFDGVPKPGSLRLNIALDWCTLRCLVEHLYPYARSSRSQVAERLNPDRIREIFHFELIGVQRDQGYDDFVGRVAERYRPGRAEDFRLSLD